MRDVAISVRGVYKSFRLPHERVNSVKSSIVSFHKRRRGFETQQVLKDINFDIKKGEFFGIVGRNGSGKSTLLKLISGIYTPDKGSITINGKLTPFIELGVGFNPELSGRDNVYLNGALLGFSRDEMEEMYDEIVAFAELERFMDQKLKNYSSGMQVRLAFSIAIRANTDILVLDEVLAVGDEAFQRKCFEYFARLKRNKKTVVLVTHDMSSVQRFCNNALLINDGEITKMGSTAEVTQEYQNLNRPTDDISSEISKAENIDVVQGSGDSWIRTRLMNNESKETTVIPGGVSTLDFVNNITFKEGLSKVFFGFTIRKDDGELVYWYTTEEDTTFPTHINKGTKMDVNLSMENIFGEGLYHVNVSIKSNDRTKDYYVLDDALKFRITSRGRYGWTLHPKVQVMITER